MHCLLVGFVLGVLLVVVRQQGVDGKPELVPLLKRDGQRCILLLQPSPFRGKPCVSSDARCTTPCRFDIGPVDQDLRECCNACLFTSVGRGKRPNRGHEGGRPLDLRDRQGASTSEIHRVAGTAAQRPLEQALFAASRRRSLSTAQAAKSHNRKRSEIEDFRLRSSCGRMDARANRGLVESGKRTPSAGSGLRDDLRLYLSPLPKGRTTLALSHAPSQTPASAPIEALARYDQRSGLHP